MILRKRKNSNEVDTYPGTQSCDVPDCEKEVFSSCHICNNLLCHSHFVEGDSCKHDPRIIPLSKNDAGVRSKFPCKTCGKEFANLKMHKCKNRESIASLESQPEEFSFKLEARLAALKSSVRVAKRIPKAARLAAASTFSKLIDNCIKLNDIESWESILSFTYKYLRLPIEQNQDKSITSIILKNFKDDLPPTEVIRNRSRRKTNPGTHIKRIIGKVSDGDLSAAVRILSSDDSVAEYSESTKSLLQAKHPSGPNEDLTCSISSDTTVLSVTKAQISSAIKSMNPGSAGGLDSLRPSHIHDMLSYSTGAAGEHLLTSLTSLCNFMLSGKVNPVVCPILYGGSLCALTKKDGGIRPIAVGNLFRRLVAKLCCFHLKESLGDLFRPLQFGFGTPGGCEAVVHSARQFLFHNNEAANEVFLKLDFRNAFNTVNRKVMLTEVVKISPDIFPFIYQCYGKPSFLMFGKEVILSQSGVQQGDPLGPMLFCLSINNLIKSLGSRFNAWYLDDGSLGDSSAVVLNDLQTVIEQSKCLGLELNFEKCELFCVNGIDSSIVSKFNSLCPNIKILNKSDLFLLGSPLTDPALKICLEAKKEKFQKMFSKLDDLPSHISYTLLKHCFTSTKFIYVLRCSPTWHQSSILEDIDNTFRHSLEKLCNNIIDPVTWKQASLPIDMGGLGIRSVSSLALPCFLSSFACAKPLIRLILSPSSSEVSDELFNEGLEIWKSSTGLTLPESNQKKQKAWDRPLLDLVARSLHESAKFNQTKARLLAVSSTESGAWLNALPVASLGTLLDNESFRIAVGLRLGSPICAKHFCKCGSTVDEQGLHGLSCRFSSGRLSRHHEVNLLIKKALLSAEIPAILEPTGTSRDDGKRPDGMTLTPWKHGRPAVWDFTCVDTLAPSHVINTSKNAGSAASCGERNKIKKYQNLQNNYLFYPLAIETFGVWGDYALKFIKDIGKQITAKNKDARSTSFLIQNISIAIQRGNAASVLGNLNINAQDLHL